MATFKVGQRVRKINQGPFLGPPLSAPNGTQGVIVAIGPRSGYTRSDKVTPIAVDYEVQYDGVKGVRGAMSDMLEPIIYDGNQVISWDACIWNPSHIHKDRIA